jgi:signal recognition particle subunit SEC65
VDFKVEFEHKIGGRKVSEQEWVRHLSQEAVAKVLPEVAKDVKAEVERLHCPVHHEHPKVVRSQIVGNELRTQVSACCAEMREKAQRIAARQT